MDKEPIKNMNHESKHASRNNADANSGSGGSSIKPPKLDFSKSGSESGKSSAEASDNGLRRELDLDSRTGY